MNYDVFYTSLKDMQRALDTACTDLRSTVVREACITLAYLSQQLKSKFASFGETALPTLMNLIQNSAKVSVFIKKSFYREIKLSKPVQKKLQIKDKKIIDNHYVIIIFFFLSFTLFYSNIPA